MAQSPSTLVQNIHNASDSGTSLNYNSTCEVNLRSRPLIIVEIVLNVGSTKLWFKYDLSNKI